MLMQHLSSAALLHAIGWPPHPYQFHHHFLCNQLRSHGTNVKERVSGQQQRVGIEIRYERQENYIVRQTPPKYAKSHLFCS